MFFNHHLFFLILFLSFNLNLINALPTVISKTSPIQHQLLSPSRKLNANNVLGRSNNQPSSSQFVVNSVNNDNTNKLNENLNSSTFSTDDVQVTLTNEKVIESNLTKNETPVNKEIENKNNANIQNLINNSANQFSNNQPIIQVDTFNSPISETENDFQCTSCLSLSNILNSATALKCCNNGYSECCGDVRYSNFNNLQAGYNQNNLGSLNLLSSNNENSQLLNSPTSNDNYGTKKKSVSPANKDKNQDLNSKETVTNNKIVLTEENGNLANGYTNIQYPGLTPYDAFSRKTSQPNKNYMTKSGNAVNLNLGNSNANNYLSLKKGHEESFVNNIYDQQINNANWQRLNNRNPNLENSNNGLSNTFSSFISHIPFIGFNPIPVVFKVSSSSNQQNNQLPANHAIIQDTHASQQINNAYNSVVAIRPQSQNAQLINPNQLNQQLNQQSNQQMNQQLNNNMNQQLNNNMNQQLNPGFVSSFLSRPMSLYQRIGGYFSRPSNTKQVLHYSNSQVSPIDLNNFLNEQNLMNLQMYNSQLGSNNQPLIPIDSLNYINPLLLSSMPYLSSENIKALKNVKNSKRS